MSFFGPTNQLGVDTPASPDGLLARGTLLGCVKASGKFVVCVPAAIDGSAQPAAILVDQVEAADADAIGFACLAGQFDASHVAYDTTWTLADLTLAMRIRGLFI